MKIRQLGLAVSGFTTAARATCDYKPQVDDLALQESIKLENLLPRSQKLQDFAYATEARNRVAGSPGHVATVDYIISELEATGAYDIERQPFTTTIQEEGSYRITVDNVEWNAGELQFSASGDVTAPLVVVSNLGCTPEDYPAAVAGNIALISRGTCEFGLKSSLAGAAGAIGALIYDNVPGDAPLSGTLGSAPRPTGPYVPTVGTSNNNGTALVQVINSGTEVIAHLDVETTITDVTSDNVLATTKCGNKDSVLMFGAHTDSVPPGPGINDDGSGTVALIEVAKQLAAYQTTNAIRFGFWSAEEVGLVGSTYYVEHLSADALAQIRAYLNFDMIASPNFIHGIYDGDGSAFNLTGPRGSAELEHFLETYFTPYNSVPTEFSGRSDYAAFIDFGVPSGGTFTGAEQLKTEAEVALFGGVAGAPYDANYHQAGDTIDNLNTEAFIIHARAIAHAAAVFGESFDMLPPKEPASVTRFKRDLRRRRNEDQMRGVKWSHDHRREVGDGVGHTHAGCLAGKMVAGMKS
ncbi:peptidase M28 [Pseudovirgaria hyperparasitica]|uniref:Peptide hydrolase n=1 Tax=Pseudovirgaria hyperparasitica TaxID=470096 RepID=A0A6A6W0D7_9PEZI|nr:peptidase M28 [Pseudovirgaria hyperparasitica]KAF2755599.1 peptidase M28 [Pseudovirgaria hyperparasitica]